MPGLAEQLFKEGILMHSCESFEGLDDRYNRIAVRTRPENEALPAGIRRCLYG